MELTRNEAAIALGWAAEVASDRGSVGETGDGTDAADAIALAERLIQEVGEDYGLTYWLDLARERVT